FHFVSDKQRQEVDVKGQDKWHYENPGAGTSTNITVDRWAAYYDNPDEGGESDTDPDVEHDGYVVYVDDQTGWDALALYAWGDAEAFGGWPGMQVTGTRKINGVVYKYFDMGEANTGLAENLIFNNNGGGSQLADFAYTIDHNLYLRITADGVEELEEPTPAEPEIVHTDGYILFVKNESSQTDLALYAWISDMPEPFGGWPGKLPDGTMTIGGEEYIYFNIGEANTGLTLNFIPNNNGGGVQWEGGDLGITVDHDIYVSLQDGSYVILDK
ncbi:MAG: starch-binding protein, partial [Prevotella sp.]|nr:starch-binding protein [Prevotella sp.]